MSVNPLLHLDKVFEESAISRTIKRIRSVRDTDDLVTHPLKRVILRAYGQDLAGYIAAEVVAGSYTPGSAYPCTVAKRAGGYRDLVFPSLVDSIVARHAIDVLEPQITEDDNDRAFCGRSHANATRDIGDYERWFQVWRDYTSSIACACEEKGYAYVFETDVASFFPSVDRERARSALESKTGAPSGIIDLLFHCLEAWLVRRSYLKGPGLPIDAHDISRLIAHNFLKTVDAQFPDAPDQQYLRFVDDTAIFVRNKRSANRVKEQHYAALTQIGLGPNSAKTAIISIDQYEKHRHVQINRDIDTLSKRFSERDFSTLVTRWYRRRKTAVNWSRVAKRLYTLARNMGSPRMRRLAISDLQRGPDITDHVLRYLSSKKITRAELSKLLDLWKDPEVDSEKLIGLSRFLCDAEFSSGDSSGVLASFATARICRSDSRPGASYARALLVLILFKHGNRRQRDLVFKWGMATRITDSQIRHHFLYIFTATGDLDEDSLNKMRPIRDSDVELTFRICNDAKMGSLKEHAALLKACVSTRGGIKLIEARYLPFVENVLSNDQWRNENENWIRQQLYPRGNRPPISDQVVVRFLGRILQSITA